MAMTWRSPSSSADRRLASLTQSAVIAAIYLALTVATSFMSFSVIQLRLAEALTALPALFPSAIWGVFLGCLLSNLLNPTSLGMVDVIAGSLVTLVSALLTWSLARPWRRHLAQAVMAEVTNEKNNKWVKIRQLVIALLPPVVLNALVVGTYLPYLLQPDQPPAALILSSVVSIFISQALIVYGLGLPLVSALQTIPWAKRHYLVEWEREKKRQEGL